MKKKVWLSLLAAPTPFLYYWGGCPMVLMYAIVVGLIGTLYHFRGLFGAGAERVVEQDVEKLQNFLEQRAKRKTTRNVKKPPRSARHS